MWAREALTRLTTGYLDVKRVLDVGAGSGEHAQYMRALGFEVTTCDIRGPADIVGRFENYEVERPFDAVWASHVLEHQLNVNEFLLAVGRAVRDNGVIAITVPPAKHEIVGGHLTLWNQGLLVYNLVLAGFDCAQARVSPLYAGYNLSVIVRKRSFKLPELKYDAGDIELLAPYFPFAVRQGFAGNLVSANWGDE